jgi:hypothetical protein
MYQDSRFGNAATDCFVLTYTEIGGSQLPSSSMVSVGISPSVHEASRCFACAGVLTAFDKIGRSFIFPILGCISYLGLHFVKQTFAQY